MIKPDSTDLTVIGIFLLVIVAGPWLLKSPPKFEDKPPKPKEKNDDYKAAGKF